jgi:hypothetical protein
MVAKKRVDIFSLPVELRQLILSYTVTEDDLRGYITFQLKWFQQPLRHVIKFDKHKLQAWNDTLDKVHRQITEDMKWVNEQCIKRAEMAGDLTSKPQPGIFKQGGLS